jgi:hypothetical protein
MSKFLFFFSNGWKIFFSSSILLLLASGCAGVADLQRTEKFQAPYTRGDYASAAAKLGGKDGLSYDKENLLTSLLVGSALRGAKSYKKSQIAFDRAEDKLLWKADKISSLGEFLEAGLTIVGNDLITSYHGNIFEGVLINTYKAMNSLDLGDGQRALVELNRADQRQTNAVIQLQAKVKALSNENDNEANERDKQSQRIDRTLAAVKNPNSKIGRRLAAVNSLVEYKDLRNPFTDWLHGVYRLGAGIGANRASNLLRDAAVLNGQRNSYVLKDFALAEKAANSMGRIPRRVWVIHEDGVGPHLKEWRFDLPVPIGRGVVYAGIALPEFVNGTPAVNSLNISADGKTYQTETLLDLDRYAATEFRAGYDTIVSKAVASTVLKVVAQVVAQKLAREQENALLGALLEIGTTLAAVATTQADTRMWRALPQSINIASMPWPADDRLRITTSSGRGVADIKLPSAQFVLVTVKTVSPRARPTFNVAPFGRKDTLLSKTITPKAWPVTNLDKKYGMLGIRQAVIQSREVPRLVHAAYLETGNGDNSRSFSNGVSFDYSIAERSTSGPNWWKPYVSLDKTLEDDGLKKLSITRSKNASGLARVVGKFFNNSDHKLTAMYRFTWMDAAGQPIDSILGNWQVAHALPSTHAWIYGTAPREDIGGFYLELVSASRVLGIEKSNLKENSYSGMTL